METQRGRTFIGRFQTDEDLLDSLTAFCRRQNIRLGVFQVIGAVKNVKMGFYNQKQQQYTEAISLDKKMEIASCTGNISLKDDEIFVHAHGTFADHEGDCKGGHLMPGTKIFAAEYYIQECAGAELVREFDEKTGLSLWKEGYPK